MYKFYMHIKCVYSLSMFTLQRNETDNIHNDILYIICMRDVKRGEVFFVFFFNVTMPLSVQFSFGDAP